MITVPEYTDHIPVILEKQFAIQLNSQQIEAIESEKGNILLLAVPGSGKTTVMVSRIAHRILNCGVDSKRILPLTFGRETARDMQRRFLSLFGGRVPEPPRFSTIHSFCLQVLNYYARRYGRQRPKLLAGQEGALLRGIYQEINGEYLTDDMLESLQNDIGLVKNRMITKNELRDYEVTAQNFSEIMEQYDEGKKRRNVMDYEDMLTFALDILQKVEPVRKEFAGRYDEIYLDEAQDTSKLQFEILRVLGKGKWTFFVGDEDQCIYSFRGAYPEELYGFSVRYPDAQVLKMEENFRCPSEITGKANDFIKMNRSRYAKEMVSGKAGEAAVEVISLDDYSRQYRRLLELAAAETGTVAVLYRYNESAIPMLSLLEQGQLPYSCRERSQRSFFGSFVVRDVLAYFQLADDPENLGAFERVCYHCYCSRAVVLYVKNNFPRYRSVWEAALDCPDASAYSRKKLLRMRSLLPALRKKPPRQAIDWIEEKLEYRDYLKGKFDQGTNRITAHLKLNILKALSEPYRTADEFLLGLDSLAQRLARPADQSPEAALTLSTIHSSKGLEFDTVVLLDMMDGILPSSQAVEEAEYEEMDEMESEARLFYVAVTRARKKLVIFTSAFCNDEETEKSRFVSRFLGESEKQDGSRKGVNGKLRQMLGGMTSNKG
ncbi:ATP-dependent helicase [Massiliimalia massiliensis]|uniref:ATP-dependent helicase n=1 Tax=Massiliimalia massiliensis TaxID=1852384 RepID=UPI000984F1E4|nr:ATP-dependent helicase [Massiliimalia massiliensis]